MKMERSDKNAKKITICYNMVFINIYSFDALSYTQTLKIKICILYFAIYVLNIK